VRAERSKSTHCFNLFESGGAAYPIAQIETRFVAPIAQPVVGEVRPGEAYRIRRSA